MTIISDADICDGLPRVEGTTVTVLEIYAAYTRRGLEPAEIATEFEVPLPRVHEAIAFYYDHVEWMRSLEASDSRVNRTRDLGPEPGLEDIATMRDLGNVPLPNQDDE